jgi:hypothetical protein
MASNFAPAADQVESGRGGGSYRCSKTTDGGQYSRCTRTDGQSGVLRLRQQRAFGVVNPGTLLKSVGRRRQFHETCNVATRIGGHLLPAYHLPGLLCCLRVCKDAQSCTWRLRHHAPTFKLPVNISSARRGSRCTFRRGSWYVRILRRSSCQILYPSCVCYLQPFFTAPTAAVTSSLMC